MARSGRSSSNKPGLRAGSWLLARGLVIPLRAHRGDEVGGDSAAPASGCLDLQWRALLQAFRHPGTGLGSQFWRWRFSEPPLLRVILVLLLSSLLAGRGGEEQGEGSSGKGVFPFLSGSLSRVLLGCMSSCQLVCCSAVPFFYARLLPPVAGAGVSTAGPFSPSAMVKWRPLLLLSGIVGVGSPLSRAQP
jgi:hypothetical protein